MAVFGTYPVTGADGGDAGVLTIAEDGLYALFSYRFRGAAPPSKLYLLSGKSELSLGVPVPRDGVFTLTRRVSLSELRRLGIAGVDAVLFRPVGAKPETAPPEKIEAHPAPEKAEAPAAPDPGGWTPEPSPARLFRDPVLRAAASSLTGALVREADGVTLIAFPYRRGGRFPLMPAVSMASLARIDGRAYVLYRLRDGRVI